MSELCLNLICPVASADRVMDCLTVLPQGHRFVSSKVSAHHFVAHLNALEQVQGRAGAMLIQVLVAQDQHGELLDALRAQCVGADLHYWLTPVFDSGAIA
jgi:hypothetical protein